MVRMVENKAIQYAISKLSMIVLDYDCIPVPGNFVHLAELLIHGAPVQQLTLVIG